MVVNKKYNPTIKDVAREAGVSIATVSRVMNNKGYLSDEIKQKVKSTMDEIGYIPNQIARSFYNKRTNVIGVIIPTIKNPYFSELVYHIEKYAETKGLKVLLCNSLNDPQVEQKYLNMLLENQVDGIIVGTHNEELREYATPNVPIIAVERFLYNKKIPTVCCDNYEGGVLATEYLIEQKCRNILCFTGKSKENYPANDRRKAFSDVMLKYNMTPKFVDVNSFDILSVRDIISKEVSNNSNVDGVFATDDIIAISIIKEYQRRGKILHQDFHVVGFDGTDIITSLYPELTTIKQPIYDMAKTSVDNLIALINGEETSRLMVLPVSIVNGNM